MNIVNNIWMSSNIISEYEQRLNNLPEVNKQVAD